MAFDISNARLPSRHLLICKKNSFNFKIHCTKERGESEIVSNQRQKIEKRRVLYENRRTFSTGHLLGSPYWPNAAAAPEVSLAILSQASTVPPAMRLPSFFKL